MIQLLITVCCLCAVGVAAQGSCKPKFGLNGAGSCVPCTDLYCLNCQADYTNCTSCADETWDPSHPIPFYVSNGTCVHCDDPEKPAKNCDLSAGCNSNGSCVKCKAGYGRVGRRCLPCRDRSCARCDGNLAVCRSCNDVEQNPTLAVYSKRIANFKLARGSCQQCWSEGCAACPGNPSVCRRCMAGYALKGTGCIECDAGCGLGNGGSCLPSGQCRACDQYYGMVNGECQECEDSNDLCLKCDNNPSACTLCQPNLGVVLDPLGKRCVPCKGKNCVACANPFTTSCLQCANGYGLVGGKCQRCLNRGCSACNGNAALCMTCSDELDDDLNYYVLDPLTKLCAPFQSHIF